MTEPGKGRKKKGKTAPKAAEPSGIVGFPGVPDRLTQAELQRVTGLSRNTLAEWAREPDCPMEVVDGKRYYLWPQWNEWRLNKVKRTAQERTPPADLEDAKARKISAEAELAELQLARELADLIRPADALRLAEQTYDRIRARLIVVPSKEAYRFIGLKRLPQAVAALNLVIDAVLQALSGDDIEPDAENEAAA